VSVFFNPTNTINSISQKFEQNDELMNNSIDGQIINDLIISVRKLFLHYALKDYESYPNIYNFVSVNIENNTMPTEKKYKKIPKIYRYRVTHKSNLRHFFTKSGCYFNNKKLIRAFELS